MRDDEPAGPRAPRPVPAALVAPFARGTGLARAWLLALLAARPLDEAQRVPLDRFARDAPRICAAVCAALCDDEALAGLDRHGVDAALVAELPAIAGARGPAAAALAVEALRQVAWRALRDDLRGPDAAVLGELGDRLAHVCGVVAASAAAAAAADRPSPVGGTADPIRVSDERPSVPAWRAALERWHAERAAQDLPCALLLAEVDDLERLLAAHEAAGLAAAIRELEEAVAAVLGPRDALVREDPGRLWIALGGEDPGRGREVAGAAAAAAGGGRPLHGAPLRLSVGVATATAAEADLDALCARAEEGVFLARAAGVPVGD